MECLARIDLDGDEVNLNNRNITSLSSALSFSPYLAKLFLQENNSLTMIPPYFFQHVPVLLVLDLSHTSIQSLPPSISRLCLLEKLILQECSLLMEVPPEVEALKNLKLFDLEGTELMYLPKQIGKLETLEHLRVSLSACADDQKDRYGVQYIIPRMMISKLSKLKELSISVDPEAEWWEVELLEAIMGELPFLPEIETLKLYLPTAKALQQFLRLERSQVPIYSSLWNYRFMIGHCEQLPFSVQLNIEESFLKLEKCVKYVNGEGYTNETVELIRDAKALYLRRHWTAEKLSVFDIRRLKYCLLMECNELQILVDQGDLYKHKNRSTSLGEDEILGSLQYLSIHFMKKLQRISKGRIGRNSLSCLRILALHTCPKLTSIFTGCLLSNMQSLTELIVEDCPKVKCLVDLGEVIPWSNGPFLLSLRRVSLIDLPELVSISGGVCIAPQLDTLLIFNCMKLNYLSVMEIPRGTKAIKGEIEWWGALKYGKLTWHNVFVQLKRDGGLMDQLAEDTNSLKHFRDLEMIPSHHGSSSHGDQNSLMDHHLGCNYVSTKEDLEHVDPLHIDSLPSSNEIQKTEDTDCDMKAVNHQLASAEKKSNNSDTDKWIQQLKRGPQIGYQVPPDGGYIRRKYLENGTRNSRHPREHRSISIVTSKRQVKVSKGIEVEIALDDGYLWWKYAQKDFYGSKYPRLYYTCSSRGCKAKKQVKRSTKDPSVFEVCYTGVHTCPTILRISTEALAVCKTFRTRGSLTATVSASTIIHNNCDDGYVWRKYGNREILGGENSNGNRRILGGENSRSYYRCTSCNAEKQVKISDDDPSIWEITYYGMHTCRRLSPASDSTGATESALSIPKNSDCLTTTESASEIFKISASSTTAESTSKITDNSFGLDSTKKMSGSASIQWWKQKANEIESSYSPSIQLPVPSSSISSKPNIIISEIAENSSRNLPSLMKIGQNAKDSLSSFSKERKRHLGVKITELHQLVSPFGKPPLIQPSDNQLSLADFDAVKVVGKGNGRIVRLVQHKWTGQFFALKVIQMNVEESARRQIAQELKINQSSQCTNVVVYYQSFYDNGAVSIILEYMDGGSLADFLKTVRSIPEPNLAAICKQVLKGLWYLHHEKHIIHRDLKPSNLLINRRGEVKITDFGVSAILASTSGLANIFVDTYNYMSPERIIGGDYGYKSDTWSLGLVLLECATGHFPYSPPQPGEGWVNVFELMENIVGQPPPRASPEQFSPQFCSFIEACVQKDPKDRASANELMSHPFINMFDDMPVDLASYFTEAGSPLATL